MGGKKLNEFCNFLDQKGVLNAIELVSFLEQFEENPGIIFILSEGERDNLEGQMDSAISAIFDSCEV